MSLAGIRSRPPARPKREFYLLMCHTDSLFDNCAHWWCGAVDRELRALRPATDKECVAIEKGIPSAIR